MTRARKLLQFAYALKSWREPTKLAIAIRISPRVTRPEGQGKRSCTPMVEPAREATKPALEASTTMAAGSAVDIVRFGSCALRAPSSLDGGIGRDGGSRGMLGASVGGTLPFGGGGEHGDGFTFWMSGDSGDGPRGGGGEGDELGG